MKDKSYRKTALDFILNPSVNILDRIFDLEQANTNSAAASINNQGQGCRKEPIQSDIRQKNNIRQSRKMQLQLRFVNAKVQKCKG